MKTYTDNPHVVRTLDKIEIVLEVIATGLSAIACIGFLTLFWILLSLY